MHGDPTRRYPADNEPISADDGEVTDSNLDEEGSIHAYRTSYERYRRAEAELTERLDEQRRACEQAAEWERIRQTMRERGSLDEFESNVRNLRTSLIRTERRAGKSLRDARLHADGVIARLRNSLIATSRVCQEDNPPSSNPAAGQ